MVRHHMEGEPITIETVEPGSRAADLWTLLREYHEWLRDQVPHEHDPEAGLATDRQSLVNEPGSCAWIARSDGEPAGCVLLYGETNGIAEFRRLWVTPTHRGRGIGRRLTQIVIDEARARDYETLGLTTAPEWEAAYALYKSLGFQCTPPYPETRLAEEYHDNATFMQLDLTRVTEDGTDGTTA